MKIEYFSTSPRGTATLDTSRLLLGTDGSLWMKDGEKVTPLTPNGEAALRGNLGALVLDAIAAAKALA